MAENVIILGAGASRYLGAPLMQDFMDAAEVVAGLPGTSRDDFERVFDLVHDRFQRLHAKTAFNQRNLEAVFSLIEMGALIARLPDTAPDDIAKYQSAIRRVLAETIEQTTMFKWEEDRFTPPVHHTALLKRCFGKKLDAGNLEEGRWAFITFNYDIALDLALHYRNYSIDYGLTNPLNDAVPLLKLHGSIHWAKCSGCQAVLPLDFDQVFRSESRRDISIRDEARIHERAVRVLSMLGDRSRGHCPDAPANPEPALVPPTWNKTQVHWGFQRLWQRAANELSEAERIWIVGYSVPASDAFFHDLLTLALASRTSVKRIYTVNPDPTVAARLQDRLGPTTRDRFVHEQSAFETFAQASVSILA